MPANAAQKVTAHAIHLEVEEHVGPTQVVGHFRVEADRHHGQKMGPTAKLSQKGDQLHGPSRRVWGERLAAGPDNVRDALNAGCLFIRKRPDQLDSESVAFTEAFAAMTEADLETQLAACEIVPERAAPERNIEDIVAVLREFAYQAAMADEKLPRKPAN